MISGKHPSMDTFRLNPDAVRRARADAAPPDPERDETDRLAERVREVEPRVAHDAVDDR